MNEEERVKSQIIYLINLNSVLDDVYKYISINNKLDIINSYKIKKTLNGCKNFINKTQESLENKILEQESRKCHNPLCKKAYFVTNKKNKLKKYCDRLCKEKARLKTVFRGTVTDYPTIDKLESLISFIKSEQQYIIDCNKEIKKRGGKISYISLSCFVDIHCKKVLDY